MKLFKIAPTSKYNSPEIIPILGDLNNILNTLASHINTSIFGCFWVLLHSQGNHATAATRFRHSGWRAAHLLWLCDTVAQQLLTADMKRSTHPILTQLNLECYSRISFYSCFSHCSTRIGVFILSLTLFVLTPSDVSHLFPQKLDHSEHIYFTRLLSLLSFLFVCKPQKPLKLLLISLFSLGLCLFLEN